MGSINTEEAARRLARVILSDIEVYARERPKEGETLEGRIEEGRRLFASRVTPDLLPVFGLVLADRAAARVNSPATAKPPSTPASTAAAAPVLGPPPVVDQPALVASVPQPPLVASVPQPALVASVPPPPVATEAPRVVAQARPIAPPAIEDPPTPVPSMAAPTLEDERLPAPRFAAPPVVAQPAPIASVPPTPIAAEAPRVVAQARPIAPQARPVAPQARPVAPPAPEIPIPVLTARVSVSRLLAVVAVVAAAGAVLYQFLPR